MGRQNLQEMGDTGRGNLKELEELDKGDLKETRGWGAGAKPSAMAGKRRRRSRRVRRVIVCRYRQLK